MRKLIASLFVLLCAVGMTAAVMQGADEKKADKPKKIEAAAVNLGRPVDFDRDILPILENNCIACHNIAIDEGKLSLEDVESVMKGGKRGPSVVPKDPQKSRLFQFASRAKNPAMPPMPNKVDAAALTPRELGLIRQWILEGAKKGMGASRNTVQWQPLPSSLNSIYSVALSPWSRFAAAGRANQISIYDLASKEQVARLVDPNLSQVEFNGGLMYPGGAAHRDFVNSLAFSPDGSMVASGGFRVVKLWKRVLSAKKFELGVGSEITAVAVSADGKLAAVAAADKTIRLWSLVDGKPGKTLTGHTEVITGLEFWPRSEEQSKVNGQVATTLTGVQTAMTNLANATKARADFDAHPDKKLDAEKLKARKEQLAAAETAAQNSIKTAQTAAKAALDAQAAFSKKAAEQGRLLSVSADKSVRVWKTADGSPLGQLESPAAVNDIAVTADGAQFVTADADNVIRLWAYPIVKPEAPAAAENKEKEEGETAIKPVRELKGHSKPVTSVALIFTPGTQIVSGSTDGTARTWDLNSGKQIRSLNHGGPVLAVAARADGQRVVSVSDNGIGKLWQTSNGKQIAELKSNVNVQRLLAEQVEEQTVAKQRFTIADNALKAADKNVKDREAAQKKAQAAKTAADKAATAPEKKAKEAGDKLQAAKAKQAEAAKAFKEAQDAAKKATQQRDEAGKKATADAEALKKTQAAAKAAEKKAADADAAVKKATDLKATADKGDDEDAKKAAAKALTDAQAAAKKAADELATAKKALTDAEVAAKASAEAKTKADAAAKAGDAKVKATDAANKASVKPVQDAEKASAAAQAALKKVKGVVAQAVRSLNLSQKAVATAKAKLGEETKDKQVAEAYRKQLDQEVAKAQETEKAASKPARAVAFSPDGKRIVTTGDDSALHLWDGTTGKPLEVFAAHQAPAVALAFGVGDVIVSGSNDKTAAAWNSVPEWKLVGQLGPKNENPLDLSPSPFANRVLALDFSRDGKLLAVGGGDPSRTGELMIWDVEKQQLVRSIEDAHSDTVMGVQFSRDGKMLVSGAADKFVKAFDVATGKLIRSYEGHTHHVLDVSLKGDTSSIVSAGADNVIKVWNTETGEQRRTISGHSKQVISLKFIGATDNFISCAGDRSVRLYTASNGRNNRSFSGGTDFMYAAACARDQSIVIAGGEDGVLRVWNASNGQSLATFAPPLPPVDAGIDASVSATGQ